MILDLDIGNSRIKWRLLEADSSTLVASGAAADLRHFKADTASIAGLSRVRVACVRGNELLAALQQDCEERWGISAEVAEVQRNLNGLGVHYSDVSRLGVDRWLAMLGAFNATGSAICVVDCGTALTIDCVAANGDHRGGFILPGLNLLKKALIDNTDIVLTADQPQYQLDLGNSTEEAIYNGSMAMLVAVIEKTICGELKNLPDNESLCVYFTGGDAKTLSNFVNLSPAEARLDQDLVFKGLSLAIP